MRKHHSNEFMRTNLNSGRIAGIGTPEGDYSEDSFPDFNPHATRTQPGHSPARSIPKAKPEKDEDEIKKPGEVKIVRPAKSTRKEVVEVCPHCMNENYFLRTASEIKASSGLMECLYCGERILLCSECLDRQCEKQPNCFEFKEINDDK